jgi:hypothetical protein
MADRNGEWIPGNWFRQRGLAISAILDTQNGSKSIRARSDRGIVGRSQFDSRHQPAALTNYGWRPIEQALKKGSPGIESNENGNVRESVPDSQDTGKIQSK